jgi:hypothetical protein
MRRGAWNKATPRVDPRDTGAGPGAAGRQEQEHQDAEAEGCDPDEALPGTHVLFWFLGLHPVSTPGTAKRFT